MKSIIDGFSEVLPASDVSFRRLHRRVTKEKLNLFEFATSLMAQAGASATKIVRCQMVNADSFGEYAHQAVRASAARTPAAANPILRVFDPYIFFSTLG